MLSYGLHLSASGALTSMYRQDVVTNNLANADTPGFKPDLALQIARDPARIEDGLPQMPSNDLMERLGGGTHLLPNIVSHAQGSLDQTDRPLDVAIRGRGFLQARDNTDPSGSAIRLTRDGRLTARDDGVLVLAASGLPVLSDRGGTITIPPGPEPSITADGTIHQNGVPIGRLGLVEPEDPASMTKLGGGLFALSPDAASSLKDATGRVESGYLEMAAVDEIDAMMDVASASRAVQANLAMMTYHDRTMEQAVRTFGRVA